MTPRFKVLQFNMQFGQVWDEANPDNAPADVATTIEEIKSHEADIIFLQEVEQARLEATQPPVPVNYTRLGEALAGYHSIFAFPKHDRRELPFGVGLAIFSRWPLHERVTIDLPSPPLEFEFMGKKRTPTDRLLIGGTIEVGGRAVRLLNTHLLAFFMLNSSSETNRGQRDQVAAILRESRGPTLIAGDFNVSKHESLIRQFDEVGFQTVQSSEVTWRRRPYVLDHIFYNDWLRPIHWAVKPTAASDHHPLVAEFEFAR